MWTHFGGTVSYSNVAVLIQRKYYLPNGDGESVFFPSIYVLKAIWSYQTFKIHKRMRTCFRKNGEKLLTSCCGKQTENMGRLCLDKVQLYIDGHVE